MGSVSWSDVALLLSIAIPAAALFLYLTYRTDPDRRKDSE